MSMARTAQNHGNRRNRPAPESYRITDRGVKFYYADGTELGFYYPGNEMDKVLWNFRAEAAVSI
jgi:hypothetical protein